MARSPRSRRDGHVREAAPPGYASSPEAELTGVLYDSDVIIEILRGSGRVVGAAAALEGAGVPTYCTAVSWAEIYAGLRPGEETLTESFFQARGEVLLDATTGRRAGYYLARYRGSHGIEIADALIAAAATTAGLRLWTMNRRHYPMPDLEFHEP
ncbi:MAG: PIN domain-containing protein [Acidobacteriota bacterium]